MKPVLILTAGYGEGHNTAANNIAAAVRHLGGTARVMDPFMEAYGGINELIRKLYVFSINRTPVLWQMFYNALDQNPGSAQWLRSLKALEKTLARALETENPGAVVSTYPATNLLLRGLNPDEDGSFFLATMVTDSISINRLWSRSPCDRFYVPNRDTADVLYRQGVDREKVKTSGFPVQLDFALPERRLVPPDLPEARPRILYVVNSGKQKAPSVVDRLLRRTDWELTVAVGRDDSLREHLSRRCAPFAERVTVIGWTTEMPKLLMTHHLLITKAGGATVQEAIAAGCPLLINQVVPGQEEGNYELIKVRDGGAFASSPEQILERARYCFQNEAVVWKRWRKNLLELGEPEAALVVARELLAESKKHS